MRIVKALSLIHDEVERAQTLWQPFRSVPEAVAIIQEEMNELWEEMHKHQRVHEGIKKEAVQVAAMAVRLIVDLCE